MGLWIARVWSGIQARPMHFLAPGRNKNRCTSQFDRETATQLIVLEGNTVLPLFIAHSYTSTCLCLNLCLHGLFLRTKPLTHGRFRLFILALCWLFLICRALLTPFGDYRTLAGGNHYIFAKEAQTVRQVLGCEQSAGITV